MTWPCPRRVLVLFTVYTQWKCSAREANKIRNGSSFTVARKRLMQTSWPNILFLLIIYDLWYDSFPVEGVTPNSSDIWTFLNIQKKLFSAYFIATMTFSFAANNILEIDETQRQECLSNFEQNIMKIQYKYFLWWLVVACSSIVTNFILIFRWFLRSGSIFEIWNVC